MGEICVLTDSSVQFSKSTFPGRDSVRILPLDITLDKTIYSRENPFHLSSLPSSANQGSNPSIILPSETQLTLLYEKLLLEFDEIVGVFLSGRISSLVELARVSARSSPARNRIHIIDSMSISSGLGYLIENAALISKENGSSSEIAQMIRESIPKIYSMFFVPSATYLAHAGIVEMSQAIISEYLAIFPIFTLEEGKLLPVQKVKNQRGVFDVFQEFLDEFDTLKMVTLTQGGVNSPVEDRIFRQYCKERFRHSNFIEIPLSQIMAVLFGPKSMGIIAIEN